MFLQVQHTFLYISFLSLYDYDVKMPDFKFNGGCKLARMKLSLSFGILPTFDKVSEVE